MFDMIAEFEQKKGRWIYSGSSEAKYKLYC